MPSNIGSLTYEHSKHITPESSLTSIVLLDEQLENDTHRMLTLGLGVHMRSISSQVYNFTSLNETIQKNSLVLDFTKICQTTFNYQIPVFQKLREALQKIFTEVKEISDLEEARKVFGIGLEPWDKYLVLDSKYFVKFLCQDLQLSTWETIVFCEFVVYSVRNELISMFKIEMHELKKEFLKYVKGVSCEAMLKIANNPESPDADWILNNIDENVIKRFYVEAKMRNWLKDYKDDYDELMGHTVPSGTQKLVTPDLKPSEKTVLQQFLESNLILKNK